MLRESDTSSEDHDDEFNDFQTRRVTKRRRTESTSNSADRIVRQSQVNLIIQYLCSVSDFSDDDADCRLVVDYQERDIIAYDDHHDDADVMMPRGLKNPGNLCFVNATLQALLSCTPFVQLVRNLGKCSIQRVFVNLYPKNLCLYSTR